MKKNEGKSQTAVAKSAETITTAQQLGSLVKSARDIMRKDKGLNGDLDRLPMLTWVMFLKFLDDMEQVREAEAGLRGEKFKPAIESPYRWRDWAAKEEGVTGDELIRFVNQEEAVRPDGTKGAGLFAYLRGLQGSNGGDRRDVIATVFKGTVNRMINGYLLRDVVNKINGIHFNSSEEIHTLGRLYESMLKEMRDAAGDSGEFYTPRAVVRLMVEVSNPRLGEVVLDPACGTGGFLVETYAHLEKQCETVQDRETLQKRSILGGEAKSLPYLLAQMNLLLHGMDYPRISPGNSLDVKLSELGDKDRVDAAAELLEITELQPRERLPKEEQIRCSMYAALRPHCRLIQVEAGYFDADSKDGKSECDFRLWLRDGSHCWIELKRAWEGSGYKNKIPALLADWTKDVGKLVRARPAAQRAFVLFTCSDEDPCTSESPLGQAVRNFHPDHCTSRKSQTFRWRKCFNHMAVWTWMLPEETASAHEGELP